MTVSRIDELRTPALVVDAATLEHNLAAMADALPGPRCRPHVKAHKTTALAQRQHDVGRHGFTCATSREVIGMDHGDPAVTIGAEAGPPGAVWFCSDEHLAFGAGEGERLPEVGGRVRVWPAHVDPTVACHERMHVVSGTEVPETWAVDLRGW